MKTPVELLEERIKEMTQARDMIRCTRDSLILKRQYNEITNLINNYKLSIRLLKYWANEEVIDLPLDAYWTKRYAPTYYKKQQNLKR